MMIPTVHLNGTGQASLLSELRQAYTAVLEAIDTVQQVTVHGRDYYPQGEHAYRQARHEMDARLEALRSVREDLLTMHRAIEQQGR